jgi:integrase
LHLGIRQICLSLTYALFGRWNVFGTRFLFRHTVGTVLAELGEHQLTIRDYLRHSNLSVTNKYLQAASNTKRNAQARLVEAILPAQLLPGKTAEPAAP